MDRETDARVAALEAELAELRRENGVLKRLLDAVEDTIFVFDPETGRPLRWNRAFREISGATDEEIARSTAPTDWYEAEDLEMASQAIDELRSRGRCRLSISLLTRNGRRIPTEYNATMIDGVDGVDRAVVASGRDVSARLDAEARAASSQAFLDAIIRHSPVSTWIADDRGVMVRMNDACAKLLDIEREEVVGCYNVLEDNIVLEQGHMPLVQRVFEQGVPARFILTYDSADLETLELRRTVVRHLHVSLFPVEDSDGRVTHVFVQHIDLTDLEKTRRELETSERRLREIADSIPGIVFQLRRSPDGSFSVPFITRRIADYAGVTREAFGDDLDVLDLVAEERPRIISAIQESAETLAPLSFDAPLAGEESVWLRVQGVPNRLSDGSILWNCVAIDVTPQKMAEVALQESERKYRSIIESNPALIVVIDPQQRHVLVNEAAVTMVGMSREQIMATNYRDLFPNHESTPFYQAVMRVMETREPETVVDRFVRDDAPSRWLEMHAYPCPEGVVFFTRDITAQRRTEDLLHRAEKMQSIGTLAGGIAHDFNNLLMAIRGYVTLILEESHLDSQLRADLEQVDSVVHRASDLTRQLLAFARGGKYEVRPTDLNALISRTVEMFSRTRKELRFHVTTASDLWTVKVDRSQIEQVLLNLLVNAWQAMGEAGEIFVETGNTELDSDYVRPFELGPGRFVRFSVTDTGVGMDEQTLVRIFEPFYTTRPMGHGTGLGLASAFGIVQNHGGIINAYSERGSGSTFNVYLPACDEPVSERPHRTAEHRSGNERILLVDDEEVVRHVTRLMLERLGYLVLDASSGKQALALLTAEGEAIDLVMLDMILHGESSREIFLGIRAISARIKILLCSGYSVNGQAAELMALGCQGFIQKPFQLADLSARLREILDAD